MANTLRSDDFLENIFQEESIDKFDFTQDFQNVVYTINNNPKEIKLLHQMIRLYLLVKKEAPEKLNKLEYGHYEFGPVVMRLLFLLNRSDIALQLINELVSDDPLIIDLF